VRHSIKLNICHIVNLTQTQQDWAQHGICGRGVLLDFVEFYTATGSPLPYDPISTYGISVADLEACARKQGVQFRHADILILRVGFIQKYMSLSQSAKDDLGGKPETLSGSSFWLVVQAPLMMNFQSRNRTIRRYEAFSMVRQHFKVSRGYANVEVQGQSLCCCSFGPTVSGGKSSRLRVLSWSDTYNNTELAF
jgi:hypothetical protein